MFRSTVAVLLLAVAISAASIPNFQSIEKIPQDIRALIPKEVVEFYKGLTPEDKTVLKDLAAQGKDIKNEEEALELLKTKSESLYTRAKAIYDLVKGKVEALDTEAKDFVKSSIEKVRALRPADGKSYDIPKVKETAKEVIAKYKALSTEAKADLEKQFPQISGLLKNEKVQKFAKGILEKN
uniref:Fatty-acid and retinol-binding protein 1 n=1 Tax=Steinernema glaseri TaxID=37863 RepID=A0A1I7YS49_9BILA